MPDSNREQLINAARLLRPLPDEVVFVGGSVTGLLITDSAAGDPRATRDVDAIAAITSYPAYVTFGERLRVLGFAEDTGDGAPLCRWVNGTTVPDVMPLDEEIPGFSNRWYAAAMAAAVHHHLPLTLWFAWLPLPILLPRNWRRLRAEAMATSSATISKT